MAVGVSSSQSLRVQVGARYRDQDPDRASSRGRCLLAPGMSFLTHRAAPPVKRSDLSWNSKRLGADRRYDPLAVADSLRHGHPAPVTLRGRRQSAFPRLFPAARDPLLVWSEQICKFGEDPPRRGHVTVRVAPAMLDLWCAGVLPEPGRFSATRVARAPTFSRGGSARNRARQPNARN